MNPPVQTVRLSKQEADILNGLKRKLKINQWNVLCRMAFCLSCADPEPPSLHIGGREGSAVEIDWQTYSGEFSEIYAALTIQHKLNTGIDTEIQAYHAALLFRGILKLKDSIR